MHRFALSVIAILLLSCGEPQCPSGYMKYGDRCRRCPPGQEREKGKCISLEDDNGAASDGGADLATATFRAEAGMADSMDANTSGHSGGIEDASAGDAVAMASDGASALDAGDDRSDAVGGAIDAAVGTTTDATGAPTDHCAPNPCQREAPCINGTNGFSCDCPTGSTGDRCELEICGDTTISSDGDLLAARSCAEIRGNLNIGTSGLVTIDAADLPHLKKVTGDLRIAALLGSTPTPLMQSATFASLQAVEGTLFVGGTNPGSVQQLYFPALTTLGKDGDGARRLHLELAPDIEVLEFPVLTTIHGDVSIFGLNRLCTLKLGAISTVTGDVTLGLLPNLPASTFSPLRAGAQGNVNEQQVGCCSVVDNVSCEAFTADSRRTYCGC